jgi:hypothetical protein
MDLTARCPVPSLDLGVGNGQVVCPVPKRHLVRDLHLCDFCHSERERHMELSFALSICFSGRIIQAASSSSSESSVPIGTSQRLVFLHFLLISIPRLRWSLVSPKSSSPHVSNLFPTDFVGLWIADFEGLRHVVQSLILFRYMRCCLTYICIRSRSVSLPLSLETYSYPTFFCSKELPRRCRHDVFPYGGYQCR